MKRLLALVIIMLGLACQTTVKVKEPPKSCNTLAEERDKANTEAGMRIIQSGMDSAGAFGAIYWDGKSPQALVEILLPPGFVLPQEHDLVYKGECTMPKSDLESELVIWKHWQRIIPVNILTPA